jgi:hypothetical protein
MTQLVEIYRPLKATIPRPTRSTLNSVVERMWKHSLSQTHDLRKGGSFDQFLAAALDTSFSNLKAMKLLSSPYRAECGALLRVLVETCVDFFWVASFIKDRPDIAKKLAENFFLYSTWKFNQLVPDFRSRFNDDVFLRDAGNPYADQVQQDKAVALSAGLSFDHSWRDEASVVAELGDITWDGRAALAAQFAEEQQNLKGAPYLPNLRMLSSYAHFDPAHIAQYTESYHDAMYDRNLNIALGFCLDMLLYSYKYKNWEPPRPLCMLNHEFVYFST